MNGLPLILLATGVAVALFAATLLGVMPIRSSSHPIQPLIALGIVDYPDKLGWMDDDPLSDKDRQRIAELSGGSYSSDLGVIRAIQWGVRGDADRRAFELLRQDRRRAQAAYPNVKPEDLYGATWLNVPLSAKVPDKFCSSGNGTQGADGKWYLDGGCYVSIVKAAYPKRADAATTKRVLAELKDTERQKRVAYIRKWGYSTSWGGTRGSGRVDCYPDPLPSNQEADNTVIAGKCVIILDNDRYEFPFDAADWIDPPYWREGLEKLAVAKGAVKVAYTPAPAKPWIRKDGLLARGETCPPGRLCFSHWNGDGYDNKDIGPSNPASWILELPFGIAYTPAPGNGEQRSEPDKPWYVVASYYGYQPQASGGWTEQEAKDALPALQTGQSFGMQGQDHAELNRGNLKEARATQIAPTGALVLKNRTLPLPPQKTPDPNEVPYSPGMSLMPGQSTSVGYR